MGAERRESEIREEEQRIAARERRILRTEKSILRRAMTAVRVADFMAILMVAATAFSGYATWRTAQVTARMFAVSDRPFLGVQSVAFEHTNSGAPAVVVDFRNYGHIPAGDALIGVHALLDGKEIKPQDGELAMSDHGNVSPGVPHFFYTYLSTDDYNRVLSGQSHLRVDIDIEYKGPNLTSRYCYHERLVYDFHSASFRHAGGTDKCTGSDVF